MSRHFSQSMEKIFKRLLSLPPNLVNCFHDIEQVDTNNWFCTSDPIHAKLGSGGGSSWLLESCRKTEAPDVPLMEWLNREKRILLHAGGQGRRIPAYAPSGKILTPIPVFRWERGQTLHQNLLSFQLPLYDRIMKAAPASIHTLIASGDVLIRAGRIEKLPEADVVCFGLWEEPALASHHGVFMIDRSRPDLLDFMLQKPSPSDLGKLMETHYFLMDIGIWLLSDKAVEKLFLHTLKTNGDIANYDLYSDFGRALGLHPSQPDKQLEGLSVAIVPLPEGEFYHYGTSHELLSSTTALMNLVKDQRYIMQRSIKQQPSIFTQNAIIRSSLYLNTPDVWIENSFIPESWTIEQRHIVTGVPKNNWTIHLNEGQCIDIVPIGEKQYALRPYGFNDTFRGDLEEEDTLFMGKPITEWLKHHHIEAEDLEHRDDLQQAEIFPVCSDLEEMEKLLQWFLATNGDAETAKLWKRCERISAEDIGNRANLKRLTEQRRNYSRCNLPHIAKNYRKSIFYQLDLSDTANQFHDLQLDLPAELPDDVPIMTKMRDAMFRAEYQRRSGLDDKQESDKAFELLRRGLIEGVQSNRCFPHKNIVDDQIVWARSAVRIDLAGGWTDTPPYSLYAGGNVVNMAINLNGQPPLQVYVKPNKLHKIVCRSIDLGAMEVITSYEELRAFNQVGSPFSIPKAALALAGFLPEFCSQEYLSLQQQLDSFGFGIDITLLSAIPAGSGLGTSSILAATVLGALSDFCGLAWDKNEICNRTLVLEQMLTTGGGWQDQYGGVLHGVKLLQSSPGFEQKPAASWLPDTLFKREDYKACHLLYYTGLTRTAKNILSEIVRGMFLNESKRLNILQEMKTHALDMERAIQKNDLDEFGHLLHTTWQQNCRLDAGTCPDTIAQLCSTVDDYCLGYKLPGAGGGGYMYMVAKDPHAAAIIRTLLKEHPLAPSARFVEMTISNDGLQISRS